MVCSSPLCVLLLLTLGASTVLVTESPRYFQGLLLPELDDVIFDTLHLEEFSVRSLFMCLMSCSQDARCVSVFYQKSSGRCRLQGGRFYLAQGGREEQGWRYYLLEMDPRCPVRSGYIHRRDLSLCYRLEFQVGANQSEAESICTQEGGHLLRIDSQEKQDHVEQQLNSSNNTAWNFSHDEATSTGYYIDGHYLGGSWIWPSAGQQMIFNHWVPNQAIPTTAKDVWLMAASEHQWLWRSVRNKHVRPFICEIDI